MSRIREVLVESTDPAPLVAFWSQLLQSPVAGDDAVRLDDRMCLRFATTDVPKQVKNRLHLDLATTSADHQSDVVRTARALGAASVDVGQGDVPWVVMADPGGNEFCVLEPREEYRDIGPLAAVVFDARDPRAQARFWSELTGLPVSREHPEYASLRQESRFWVEFVRVDEPKAVRNRLHLVVDADAVPV
ncbi:VOC family protein [Mycolicibacterium litorale]|uniref:VOC family protein n=1 Tax=Mycolicibacterium litorale TaxID=758802 RepID=UPI003CFA7881